MIFDRLKLDEFEMAKRLGMLAERMSIISSYLDSTNVELFSEQGVDFKSSSKVKITKASKLIKC